MNFDNTFYNYNYNYNYNIDFMLSYFTPLLSYIRYIIVLYLYIG